MKERDFAIDKVALVTGGAVGVDAAVAAKVNGTPGEVAATVAFLPSPGAACLTGVALPVDAGFLASGARNV